MEYHRQQMNVNKTVHIGLGMMLRGFSSLDPPKVKIKAH